MHDDVTEPASDLDLAIERALETAGLRAGDALGGTVATSQPIGEPTAAEAGVVASLDDGD